MTEQFNATKPVSISRLRDESLEESGNLDPDVLAQEIVEDLEAALEQFREIPPLFADWISLMKKR